MKKEMTKINELDEWGWMKKTQNEIGNHLCKSKSQGIVTVEQRNDKFVITAIIPKDGLLKIDSDDIPLCRHILG